MHTVQKFVVFVVWKYQVRVNFLDVYDTHSYRNCSEKNSDCENDSLTCFPKVEWAIINDFHSKSQMPDKRKDHKNNLLSIIRVEYVE